MTVNVAFNLKLSKQLGQSNGTAHKERQTNADKRTILLYMQN